MTPPSTEISPPTPVDPATRLIIGEADHRYPLLEELPLATRILNPKMSVIREANGQIRLNIPLQEDEAIWGFGQRLDAFNLRGTRLESWATDGWNATDTSYYAVPFFISSRGYGLFVNHPGRIAFDIGVTDPNMLTIQIPDDGVELFAFEGIPADISRRYTELIGRPRPVPDWIFRPWISRNSYLGAYEVDRITAKMRSLGMPVGVAVLEAWEEQLHNFRFTTHRYPDTAAWIKKLNEQDVHIVCWLTSSVWADSEAYLQAKEHGYLVLNDDGSEHIVRWLENGRKIDFRKPEARAWWRDLHKPLIELGVEGFKTDGGEHMPDPLFHNQHTYYYQQASLDAFRDLGRRGITFARSADPLNAGLSTFWSGDQKGDWRGLRMVVRGGISTALCGFPFWGHDIGGYTDTSIKEVYVRWLQFGAFSPIMQFHGLNAHEPWQYDEETVAIARFYFQVREKLLRHLIAWGNEARENGTPIIRPMVWYFPDDPAVASIDNQFFLGPDLLVAPITDPVDARGIYLPAGAWVDLWNGEKHEGPKQLLYTAPLHRIPVFARAEAFETYRDLFAGEPEPSNEPISITLTGPKNDRGIVPNQRYVNQSNEPEPVIYELRNQSDTSVQIAVRLRFPATCRVEPNKQLNVLLEPGEVQRVAYFVSPASLTTPGSHTVKLEATRDGKVLESPPVTLVVSPVWKVLGLFEGGVGSTQDMDAKPAEYNRTWHGRHGHEIRWVDVPASKVEANGLINLDSVIGAEGSSTYYLATDIKSDRIRDVTFHAGFGDAMTVWLNGREIASVIGHRNADRDEDTFTGSLQAGTNHILIRNSRDLAPSHFYFRVSHK